MKIAIDAMGGDSAPASIVGGAMKALRNTTDLSLILVGDVSQIESELQGKEIDSNRLHIQEAPDVIGMGEPAVEAIRNKEGASINICVKLVKEGEADALISAGNTGATVSASTLNLGLLEQIHRPGIASPIPHETGVCSLIDVGANIYCKPHQLLQYAVMASVFQRNLYDIADPAVGLLNIGEEEEKGNDLVRETHPLLKKSHLNFMGNVEGQAAFSGDLDVLVTEGYIGNVILKFLEGEALTLVNFFKQEMKRQSEDSQPTKRDRRILSRVQSKADYSEHGGAPLLGVNGVCIICHGRSGEKAIRNAIEQAARFHEHQINEHILEGIRETEDLLESVRDPA